MIFKELVNLFNKLSKTTKRLEMTSLLSEFLKKTNCEDIGFVVLLCTGRVFPKNEDLDLGIANNMMIKALSSISGFNEKKVKRYWKECGDLGEVAKKVVNNKTQTALVNKGLTLNRVKETLRKLPTITGKGSVGFKLKTINSLLNSASGDEALYLTRIILGNMRTGVGKGTVRDALSQAFKVSGELVERAYNLRTDYSYVSEMICKDRDWLKSVSIELFTPVNVMLFQKSESVSHAFEQVGKPAIVEIKYDGIRAQVHKKGNVVKVYTRNLDEVTSQFPDVVKMVKDGVKSDSVILECEIVSYDKKSGKPLPFQNISKRVKRKHGIKAMINKVPVRVYCFDLLYNKGESFLNKPFKERHEELKSVVKSVKGLSMVEGVETSDEGEALDLFKKGVKDQEGVMFKNLNAVYQAGSRVGFGVKLKTHMKELDLLIIEAYYGKGRRSDWFGSFTLACYDNEKDEFLTIGKLGTGFTDEELADMNELIKSNIVEERSDKVVLKPSIVVEVEYEEIQESPTYSSGYALRFPRLVRFRSDKKPEEVNTINQIKELI